jgi:RecA-family ATPase
LAVSEGLSRVEGEGQGSVSDFADLIEQPVKPVKAEAPPFTPVQVAKYVKVHTPVEWFVHGVLPKAEICAVIGDSGSGKTFFILDMVLRIAAGMGWRNKKTRRGRVVYVAAEGAQGIKTRVDAWARHHGVDLEQVDLHIIGAAPSLLDPKDVGHLVKALLRLGNIDLVVLDTLAQVTPGAAENSSEDMGKALAHCKSLHATIKATILLVGHTGKDASRGLRGWSGIRAALDALVEITRLDTYRGATVTKLKDGKGEGEEYLFQLENMELDYDFEYDEPITSCVVLPLEGQEAAKAKKGASVKGKWELLVMEVAEEKWGLSGDPFKESNFIEEVVAASPETGSRVRDSVVRAFKTLVEKGVLVCEHGMVAVP